MFENEFSVPLSAPVDHQAVIAVVFQVIVEVDTIQVTEAEVVTLIKVIVEDLIIIIEEVIAVHHRM
jgi:hypothetical protein